MGVSRVAVCLLLGAWLLGGADRASELYKQGRAAEREGDVVRAYLLYAQAAALDPDNRMYWLRSQALRTQATLKAKIAPEPALPSGGPPPAKLDPDLLVTGPEGRQFLEESRQPLPPVELVASPARKTFDIRKNLKGLWEEVTAAYGLDVVFDGDYDAGQPLRFRMEDAGYRDALHALEAVTSSFIVPLSERLFLVVKDTQAKRRDAAPTVTVVLPVPEPVALQEVTEMTQAVRQALDSQKFFVDSQRRLVVLRDQVGKVQVARRLVEQLLYHRPEVTIEVEALTAAKHRTLTIGAIMQTSTLIAYFGGAFFSKPSLGGFTKFLTFGGGKTLFGIGILDPAFYQLIATESKSEGRTLIRGTVRSVDGQQATLLVGERYPIQTGAYIGDVTGPGKVYTPPPPITFEDLGVSLKLKPRVHNAREVTLEIDAEFKLLTGQSVNDIPVLSNRKVQGTVRLKFGEYAVVSGLMGAQEARSISGLAGLSTLPHIGALFSKRDSTKENQELMLLLRPTLLSLPPSELALPAIRAGTETRPPTAM